MLWSNYRLSAVIGPNNSVGGKQLFKNPCLDAKINSGIRKENQKRISEKTFCAFKNNDSGIYYKASEYFKSHSFQSCAKKYLSQYQSIFVII